MTKILKQLKYQRGVAVVTALLLTTLAITIVASLFWQQQVQVRSIENQRLQLQKKWIFRGAIDWARLILREDARQSGKVDYLGEPWAVKLEDTRLDQYVENGKQDTEASEASLSGQIVDAQAMYNLNNLATDGIPDAREIAVYTKLLTNLRLPSELAKRTANMIAQTQIVPVVPKGAPDSSASQTAKSAQRDKNEIEFVGFTQVDDLLSVPGYTPEMVYKLKTFVTVLPRRGGITAVNLNTAPAEVLSARIEGVSMSDAAVIVASRERAYFNQLADFQNRFPDKAKAITEKDLQVWTSFFIVNGKVKMSRSALDISALIERADDASTTVIWLREN
jgi:general secretion pathway protein K